MKVLKWVGENKNGIAILSIFLIIIILGLTGVLDWILEFSLGGIIMVILILIYFFDRTQYNQIHGKKTTDVEDAKKRNPFIK